MHSTIVIVETVRDPLGRPFPVAAACATCTWVGNLPGGIHGAAHVVSIQFQRTQIAAPGCLPIWADYNGLSRVWAGMCHAGKKQQLSGAQLKTKGWILKKKAQMRKKGYTSIPVDTKYTGRKRKKIV
jgi:hypothetical protein